METLKISDLSVGDWVEYEGLHYPITFVGYGEGGDGSLVNLIRPDLSCFICKISDIHPVPITAEILEKNGWENLRSGYKCSCGVYDIHIWIKEASVIVTIYERERILKAVRMQVYSPDMSVHQLQHILRLAGVDKEINL